MSKSDTRDRQVIQIQKDVHSAAFEQFVQSYNPFILSVVTKYLNRYVSVENDEEYAVALEAFVESIQKYEIHKGSFLSFATLVMKQRLMNHSKKENRHVHDPMDMVDQREDTSLIEDEVALRQEIQEFERELLEYGIEFNALVSNGPRHKDTKEQARRIADLTSQAEDLLLHLYRTKRLPITKMASRFAVSAKIIKGNKAYIISLILIMNKFESIKKWIL